MKDIQIISLQNSHFPTHFMHSHKTFRDYWTNSSVVCIEFIYIHIYGYALYIFLQKPILNYILSSLCLIDKISNMIKTLILKLK